MDEEGNTIAELQRFVPPLEVIAKVFVNVHRFVLQLSCSPLGGEDPIDEESAGEKHIAGVEQLTCERGKLLFSCFGSGEPVFEQRGEG